MKIRGAPQPVVRRVDSTNPAPPPTPDPVCLFSCVAENGAGWCDKVERLALSIREFGGKLAGAQMVVNFVDDVHPGFPRRLAKLGAETRVVKRFHARVPPANKLRMLELEGHFNFDVLIALDCDLLVTGDLSRFASLTHIGAVPESRDPFTRLQWQTMFEGLAVPEPPRNCLMSATGESTYPYYKSGVLFVPRRLSADLHRLWGGFIHAFDDLHGRFPGRPPKHWFADQIGLACAGATGEIAIEPLPVNLNFPFRLRLHRSVAREAAPPFVIHYGNQVDDRGFVLASSNRVVNPLIHAFNRHRSEVLQEPYARLGHPPLPLRLQRTLAARELYRSPAVKAMRRSRVVKKVKKTVMGADS